MGKSARVLTEEDRLAFDQMYPESEHWYQADLGAGESAVG